MGYPKVPATPVIAGAIALVLGASLVLAGGRGGSAPSSAPETPTPTPTESETATARPTAAPTKSTAPRSTRKATAGPKTTAAHGRCEGVDADFNGDGYADLVIGIPGEDTAEVTDAGAVNVIYGRRSGLARSTQVFSQNTPGILESADEGDRFGESLSTGDFNGDGYTDLAVGVPGEVITGFADGAVNVIYGSRSGLTAKGNQVWSQNSPGVPEESASAEQFSKGLASGDFNRDGYSDLAIGAPFEDIKREGFLSAYGSAGAVTILFGSRSGVASKGALLISQDTPGVPDDVEAVDLFGWALASADFDGDGFCDLVISSPGERIDGEDHGGSITAIPGGKAGLDTSRASLWHQNMPGVPDTAEANDEFGRTMAIGDFDGDRLTDLAIGTHGEDLGDKQDAGSVTVLYGTRKGLSAARVQVWTEDSAGILDSAEGLEGFSLALVGDDFDGDGADDLGIGVPFESFPPKVIGEAFNPGVVHVLFGVKGKGLRSARNELWSQDSPGVADEAEHDDKFGLSLGAGDLNGDGSADLIVGAPGEKNGAGVVHVLFGSGDGVISAGNRLLGQGQDGIPDQPDAEDGFGSATAAS